MKRGQVVSYRLGIDLGTSSLGFALVELKNNLPFRILHMGVRMFSDGREAQTGTSLAVDRRNARGMRRRRDRLVRRQQQLMEILVDNDLMPKNKAERKQLESIDPYALRKKGLDEKLSPYELGRALFHINQRRGFQSNRKQAVKEKETGAINDAKTKLETLLQEHRTIGEFLYSNPVKRVRPTVQGNKTLYDFYPQRDMLKHEYDLLLTTQSQHYPSLLTPKLIEDIKEVLFFQRPLKPVRRGPCSLMPEEERAYAALPSSQYFRLLKEVNNLKIQDKLIRRNRHDLQEDQRKKAIAYLSTYAEVKFSRLAKKIGLRESESFNLESDVRDKIYGLETMVTLSNKKCFGELWPHSLKEQDQIVLKLLEENEERNEEWLYHYYPELTEEQIDNILSASAILEEGTLRYCTEAIEKLIPQLESKSEQDPERYKNEYEAVIACGWQYASHYTGEIMMDELPYYGKLLERKTQVVKYGSAEEKEYGKIANPTVHVALNQLRKVLNDIIKEFGHPAEIAIEFSRELKLTKKEKENRSKVNRKNQEANKRYDDAAKENGYVPSGEARLRQKLWEQQDRYCIYSGKKLSLNEVLGNEVEIDHILPLRRTLDDTSANKVLVLREYNRRKENKSPYEFKDEFQKLGIHYDELLTRISSLPGSKKWRFLPDAMQRFEEERKSGDAGWMARQLNDTSYMARVAREYLRYVVGDRPGYKGFPAVDTYPGGVTAKLRRGWGFNSLLNPGNNEEKNRDDHRHHAIDALVIACANRSMLNAISNASGKGETLGKEWYDNLPPPYSSYNRTALQAMVDNIIISHKPDHGSPGKNGSTSGRLHEDTFYGRVDAPDVPKGKIRLVVRMPIMNLREEDVKNIHDKLIRKQLEQAICQRMEGERFEDVLSRFIASHHKQCVETYENSPNKNKTLKPERIRHIRVTVEKSQKTMKALKDKTGKPYRYVATGSNHHIDIFCPIKDKKELKIKAGQWYAEIISTFDANQKGFEPQWRKDHPTAKLIMRLHVNDMVAYEEGGQVKICRLQKISNKTNGIFLKQHNDATSKNGWGASASQLQKKNARKIAITPAGKILDPGKAPMPKACRQKLDNAA